MVILVLGINDELEKSGCRGLERKNKRRKGESKEKVRGKAREGGAGMKVEGKEELV